MTSRAAFQATYSDWRLVRSRKVVQIVLEVPLEASGDAYEVLGGMPNPGEETWCAVARLRKEGDASDRRDISTTPDTSPASDSPSPAPVRARTPFSSMSLAQQAGMLCHDGKFQAFLRETHVDAGEIHDNLAATEWVRGYCDVQSRAEIRPGTTAENRWLLLVSAYRAWELAPACGIVA